MRRSELERRILRTLAKPMTRDNVLGAIPCPNEPGGGWSDEEVRNALHYLIECQRVLLVRAPKAKRDER